MKTVTDDELFVHKGNSEIIGENFHSAVRLSAVCTWKINVWSFCVVTTCLNITRIQFVLCCDCKKMKLVKLRSVSSFTCLLYSGKSKITANKMTPRVPLFHCSFLGAVAQKMRWTSHNLDPVARIVQLRQCEKATKARQNLTFTFRKNTFNTTSFSQVCSHWLYFVLQTI